MQSNILHLFSLGCLVLLFGSVYRKRKTLVVRFWVLGWLLILCHYAANVWSPGGIGAQRIQSVVSTGSLFLCGAAFLFPLLKSLGLSEFTYLPGFAFLAALAIIVFAACSITVPILFYLCIVAAELCWFAFLLRLRELQVNYRRAMIAASVGATAWMVWSVHQMRPDVAVSSVLSQVFLSVAILYLSASAVFSAGSLTVISSLFCWSAVFPIAEWLDHLQLLSRTNPEVWNVPKYFVAFGMILVLFEEEVVRATESEEYYKLLFQDNPLAMWIYDKSSLKFKHVNDAAVRQYGYTEEDFNNLFLPQIEREDHKNTRGQDDADSGHRVPLVHQKRNGSEVLVDVVNRLLRRGDQQLVLSLIQDVTEQERLHQELKQQANHDALTGLPNRAHFEEQLRKTLSHSARHGAQAALLCLDADRFKQINDTYGHDVGDTCLKELSARLKQRVRSMDTVARTGGEEFCILLHEISNLDHAERVAYEILVAFQQPVAGAGYRIEMTASIGIAICPDDGMDATTLWRHADTAMYQAKKAGGNQVTSMSAAVRALMWESNRMEGYLRAALRDGGLEVQYQPLYRITGELDSLEALVRLHHPQDGLISPDAFISVAEDTGMIVPLGHWVLNEVCGQMIKWQVAGRVPVRIAVNVSALEIARADFAEEVVRTLSSHGVNPRLLNMEITETAVMRNLAEASRQVENLAALGVQFSIDDFGTGYSSLGQLDALPVQTLKIDRSFIARLGRATGTYSIVDAIISMSSSLNLKVAAEGVESEEQLCCLRHLGCDLVQGFYLSRPISAAATEELLARLA